MLPDRTKHRPKKAHAFVENIITLGRDAAAGAARPGCFCGFCACRSSVCTCSDTYDVFTLQPVQKLKHELQ